MAEIQMPELPDGYHWEIRKDTYATSHELWLMRDRRKTSFWNRLFWGDDCDDSVRWTGFNTTDDPERNAAEVIKKANGLKDAVFPPDDFNGLTGYYRNGEYR